MKDIFALKGKVVILTGGRGFLGQQYAEALNGLGAEVVIWDVVGSDPVDITSPDQTKKKAAEVFGKFGRIDALINNAALNPAPGVDTNDHWARYEDFPLGLWDKEMAVNLKGAMAPTQAVAPYLMRQRSGSVVFVASDLALIAPNNSIYEPGSFKDIAYVASKAGVLGLMRAWASYLGPAGVRCNALLPGGMRRGQTEEFARKNGALNMLGRMAESGEFNGPMAFLVSDASSYMTGATLVIDGGRTAW